MAKIIHLITSLGGGGTENFLHQILSGSPDAHRHEVYFLGKDGVNGERIRRLGITTKRTNPIAFYAVLRREKPDVLHTCLYWAHQVGRITGHAAQVPLIISSHQSIDVWQKPWHGWIDRWTLPLCDIVDINSQAARRVLEQRLKNASKRPRLVSVPNGVDFNLFKPTDRAQAKRSYSIPEDAIAGGALMRLHPEKGAEKIPTFARALLEAHPKLYLLIGGTGSLEDFLKEQTKDLGSRIRWLGWQDDAAGFLSALDFFWLLSREESFPQALLEASAMGLPWLATDVGGVHELLDAGAAGLLAPASDAAKISMQGNALLKDLSAFTEKARSAVERLSSRFSVEAMRQAFYDMIE